MSGYSTAMPPIMLLWRKYTYTLAFCLIGAAVNIKSYQQGRLSILILDPKLTGLHQKNLLKIHREETPEAESNTKHNELQPYCTSLVLNCWQQFFYFLINTVFLHLKKLLRSLP